jgi:hypothetical protein
MYFKLLFYPFKFLLINKYNIFKNKAHQLITELMGNHLAELRLY